MNAFRAAPLVFAAGCFAMPDDKPLSVSPPPRQPDMTPERIRADVESLKMAHIDMMKQFDRLERMLGDQAKLSKDRIDRLEQAYARLIERTTLSNNPDKTEPSPPGPPASPPAQPKVDPIVRLSEVTTRMKQRDLSDEEAKKLVEELLPIGAQAVSRLLEELRRNLDSSVFVGSFETLLAAFPPEYTRGVFGEALKEIRLRGVICEAIGKSRNLALSRALDEFLGTADDNFRGQIADAMVACRNPAGIPALLYLLSSDELSLRELALIRLKKLSEGQTFGYQLALSPQAASNREAIRQWNEWYDRAKPNLFNK